MKIANLFLAGLIAIAFMACNNDVEDQLGQNGEGKDVKGYLSVTIQNTSNLKSTRTAANADGTENGIGDENKISSITAVLTDDNGLIESSVTISSADITENESKPFEVKTGTYKLYTLVNMPANVNVTQNQNIQQLITVSSATEATLGYNSGSFFMVNAKHNGVDIAGVDVTITSANTETRPAKSTVNVDRVAVKIVPEISTPNVTITTDPVNVVTGVTMLGYLPLNVNEQFNLIQDWGTENKNSTVMSVLPNEALQTPLYPGTGLVKDQYFHNISEYTLLHKDVVNTDSVIAIEDLTKSMTFRGLGSTVYTTENRPTILTFGDNQPTAGRGETTGIIYKVQASGADGELGTFFVYNGIVYTERNALNLAFEPVEDISSINDLTVLRAKGIKVYEDGIMYYTYFIRGTHNDNNHKYNNVNYFGVFRNSVYRLTVNNITALGDDVPGGGSVDPEKPGEPGNPPIDTDEAYIAVTVNVNPWVLNTIGIDF